MSCFFIDIYWHFFLSWYIKKTQIFIKKLILQILPIKYLSIYVSIHIQMLYTLIEMKIIFLTSFDHVAVFKEIYWNINCRGKWRHIFQHSFSWRYQCLHSTLHHSREMVTSSMHALQYRRREGGGGLKIKNTFKTEFQTFREESCSERGELKPMRNPNTFPWIHIIIVVTNLLN